MGTEQKDNFIAGVGCNLEASLCISKKEHDIDEETLFVNANDECHSDHLQNDDESNLDTTLDETSNSTVKNLDSQNYQQIYQNEQSVQVDGSVEQSVPEACGSASTLNSQFLYLSKAYSPLLSTAEWIEALDKFEKGKFPEKEINYILSNLLQFPKISFNWLETTDLQSSIPIRSLQTVRPIEQIVFDFRRNLSTAQKTVSVLYIISQHLSGEEQDKVLRKLDKEEFPKKATNYMLKDLFPEFSLIHLSRSHSHIQFPNQEFCCTDRNLFYQILINTVKEIIFLIDKTNIYQPDPKIFKKIYPEVCLMRLKHFLNIAAFTEDLISILRLKKPNLLEIMKESDLLQFEKLAIEQIRLYLDSLLSIMISIKHVQEAFDSIEPYKNSEIFLYEDKCFLSDILNKRILFDKLVLLSKAECIYVIETFTK